MPRPRKCRMVGFVPDNKCFYPQVENLIEVVLSIEEVEAIRLSDYLEMEQDKAALSMNVSRGTFQRMINSARMKIADAFVNGKTIRIEGGLYEISKGKVCFKRHTVHCKQMSCDQCENCEQKNIKNKGSINL